MLVVSGKLDSYPSKLKLYLYVIIDSLAFELTGDFLSVCQTGIVIDLSDFVIVLKDDAWGMGMWWVFFLLVPHH